MIKREIVVGVKGFPWTGEAFNTILYAKKIIRHRRRAL